MTRYSAAERDMAAKGFVYLAKVTGSHQRKFVRKIDSFSRAELVFDRPAYETAQTKEQAA